MSTHARPLADWLAAASDAELDALFGARGVRADVGWQDFFDAAESLLEAASLSRVLPTLTRDEASALARAAQGGDPGALREPLIGLGLLRPDGQLPEPVAAAVRERPAVDVAQPGRPNDADEASTARAAEHAFTTVGMIADLILATKDRPRALIADGSLSAVERKDLAEHGVPADAVDSLVDLAALAGLLTPVGRQLYATTSADGWLRSSVAERWEALVEGFRAGLPRGIRTDAGGWTDSSLWRGAYPWDPDWSERSAGLEAKARLLGLRADDGSEPEWAHAVREGGRIGPEALIAHLPAEVDRLFLQNDLTAIAPGPLASAVDVRLRTVAERESAAQASTYRFTPESVAKAFAIGETVASLSEFLESISLTGVPQPLSYLIEQTGARHGMVRVLTDAEPGRTRIESSDPALLQMMAVDQTLRPLGLSVRDGHLTTNAARDAAYWALTDARYPASLVDADGRIASGGRHPAVAPPRVEPADYSALVSRLREGSAGADADAAWLGRELEAAVRAKAVLRVAVGMPDGSTRELLLEVTGLGGGRLRGRDRAADVERTLPVSSIRSAAIEPS
ncbi:helicase-associated domain-containing protein [Microbacterium sp. ZW T5_45]|uniref:helicase-associated domain-containing protein n=1 Tax=Microbacterium sp. ZW T5_45 TaxID=3378080 RepID=UPI003853D8DF